MLLDLVSPWRAAVEADPGALRDHRLQHAALLERLRQIHTPHLDAFPLLHDEARPPAQQFAAILPALHHLEHRLLGAAAEMVPPANVRCCLLVSGELLDPLFTIPRPDPVIVLRADSADVEAIGVQMARGIGLLIGWSGHDGPWSPWDSRRRLPFRAWIHAHGMAWHCARHLLPEVPLHRLFGVSLAAWQRLRERESACRVPLLAELSRDGMSTLLQWLPADPAQPPHSAAGVPLPVRMGHYLAWRLTAPRVARLGIAEALRADP